MLKAPPISKDLLDYLAKVYSPALIAARPDTQPHEIAAIAHREQGVQSVIAHLRAVYEAQQNEDPLNVSEAT